MSGQILLAEHDPLWGEMFRREAEKIRGALGARALRIEHVGSTAVPGLAAKPVIDVVLVVADSKDEDAYLPALETAGYSLRIREPKWHEHRMFNRAEAEVNLHVFPGRCKEVERMVIFRDWLRGNAADRDLYARTKSDLAQREWKDVQDYADAKTAVVKEILARARAGQR